MKPTHTWASVWLSIAFAPLGPALVLGAGGDTGYSALAEITADNVDQLKVVFSFKLPAATGYAVIPQSAGDTLFVLTPFPQTLYALKAFGDAPGAVKWRYSLQV